MWVFSKHEEPHHVGGLILVAQPTLEQLDRERAAMRRRHREAVELCRQARNAVERRERAERIRRSREHKREDRQEKLDRIAEFLKTCEQGLTVEQVADACGVSCREVRYTVTYAKRKGWLLESSFRSHVLLRVEQVTP